MTIRPLEIYFQDQPNAKCVFLNLFRVTELWVASGAIAGTHDHNSVILSIGRLAPILPLHPSRQSSIHFQQ